MLRIKLNVCQKQGFIIAGILIFMSVLAFAQESKNLKLWYDKPANQWNEALPVGNGSLGAMVFGGVFTERLQLNEESVWSGKPADFVNPEARRAFPQVRKLLFEGKYAEAQKIAQDKLMGNKTVPSSYQTLGDLTIRFDSTNNNFTGYSRELDINTAIATTKYKVGEVTFTREVFASAPDKALVVRISADQPEAISGNVSLSRQGGKALIKYDDDEIEMSEHVGNGVGVQMVCRVKLLNEGGTIKQSANSLAVSKANAVTIYLTAATNYWKEDPFSVSAAELVGIKEPYPSIKRKHIEDYQKYFKRVDLNLGKTDAVYFPTDARLKALHRGSIDPQLIALYYQYGRYLLISSSRPGGLPSNLQGIWADGLNPPWDADYHININIQMNYWPAEITNLAEMHMPFLNFINDLRADGRKTAKEMYGIKGAVTHFTTDAWHFTEPYGEPRWAMWPMGMAWSAQHHWHHFLFTEDKEYLKSLGYPVMKDAATFCANWLVENPETKMLVSGPSISPENTFVTKDGEVATMVMGPTMDHMIIRDLFQNTIKAGKILNTDRAFGKKLEAILERIPPTQIGNDGRIMEWTEAFKENEPGHRHISHLFALHPGNEITKQKNPELLEAARKTINYRLSKGGGHTGWSRAWIINFFARLQDSEAAYENLMALLQKSTLPNLFDTHPPFQIDGNFGATAGITEMLLQSHAEEIELLPALPTAWPNGNINGLMARGGFEIDQYWENGKLLKVEILSKLGNQCVVRYNDKVTQLETVKEKVYVLDENLKLLNNK